MIDVRRGSYVKASGVTAEGLRGERSSREGGVHFVVEGGKHNGVGTPDIRLPSRSCGAAAVGPRPVLCCCAAAAVASTGELVPPSAGGEGLDEKRCRLVVGTVKRKSWKLTREGNACANGGGIADQANEMDWELSSDDPREREEERTNLRAAGITVLSSLLHGPCLFVES